jgi:hypothetical protein
MPSEMSAVWWVRHIFHACGMNAVVVNVAAALPIQSIVSMAFIVALAIICPMSYVELISIQTHNDILYFFRLC